MRIAARRLLTTGLARRNCLGPAARLRSGVVDVVHASRLYSLIADPRQGSILHLPPRIVSSSSSSSLRHAGGLRLEAGRREWLGGRGLRRPFSLLESGGQSRLMRRECLKPDRCTIWHGLTGPWSSNGLAIYLVPTAMVSRDSCHASAYLRAGVPASRSGPGLGSAPCDVNDGLPTVVSGWVR